MPNFELRRKKNKVVFLLTYYKREFLAHVTQCFFLK